MEQRLPVTDQGLCKNCGKTKGAKQTKFHIDMATIKTKINIDNSKEKERCFNQKKVIHMPLWATNQLSTKSTGYPQLFTSLTPKPTKVGCTLFAPGQHVRGEKVKEKADGCCHPHRFRIFNCHGSQRRPWSQSSSSSSSSLSRVEATSISLASSAWSSTGMNSSSSSPFSSVIVFTFIT